MSDTELSAVLEEGEVAKCLAFFAGMPEERRRELAPQCIKWVREIKKEWLVETKPGTFSRNHLMSGAEVAAFATGTFSELKKLNLHPDDDMVFELLTDRQPDWVDEWVLSQLTERYYWRRWRLVRRLMAAGLANKPNHPNYYVGMIGGISHRGDHSIEKCLLDEPDLLEDEVWRLFEYDGAVENSLANVDRFSGGQSWCLALVNLMKAGRLPRKRLLDCALDALDRDFNHYRAKWFSAFFDALEPTAEEQTERGERFLNLLAVSAPNIVSWAYKKVEALNKAGALDPQALIAALRPVLESRHKGITKKAIKLLERTAKKSSDVAPEAARVVTVALGHEASEVQEQAIDLIEKFGSAEDAELAESLAAFADAVSPSMRKRLAQLTDQAPAEDSAAVSTEMPDLETIDRQLRRLFGLDALVEAIEQQRVIVPAATFDGADISRLTFNQRLQPITDLDELIEVCARVIEDASLVDDAERAFDGLARLCGERPSAFDQRIAPLLKRTIRRLKKDMAPFMGIGPDDDLCGVVYAWGTGNVIAWKERKRHGDTLAECEFDGAQLCCSGKNTRKAIGLLTRRSQALAQRVAEQRSAPLLSAATHSGGWIDPAELVRRVEARTSDDPDVPDVCLAMLRLAPEGRDAALAQIPRASAEWIRAIRYALGADDVGIGKTPALWCVAARCRAPWDDDKKVEKAFPNLGPDGGVAARYEFQVKSRGQHYDVVVKSEPALPKVVDINCATVAMHNRRLARDLTWELGGAGGRTVGSVRWTTTVWPQARESFFGAAAVDIGHNLDWWEAQWQNKSLLEPLLDPGTPLREMGLLLLALALAAKEPGEHGLAIDIAIRAIEEGRLGSDNLGSIMKRLLPTGLIKPGRWKKNLSEVARVSPVHAVVVQLALQQALSGKAKQMPRDYGQLLELLKELSIELGLSVTEPACRELLSGLKGSSKAAKAAKAILAVEKTESDAVIRQALTLRSDAARAAVKS